MGEGGVQSRGSADVGGVSVGVSGCGGSADVGGGSAGVGGSADVGGVSGRWGGVSGRWGGSAEGGVSGGGQVTGRSVSQSVRRGGGWRTGGGRAAVHRKGQRSLPGLDR